MKYLTRKEELLLLTVHRLKDNAYLVEIMEHLSKYTDQTWSVGNVYVPLDKLKLRGYLDSYIGEPTAKRGGKAIKYYKLTEQGSAALAQVKKLHDSTWDGIADII